MDIYRKLGGGYSAHISRVVRRRGQPATIHGMLIDESPQDRESISFVVTCVRELTDAAAASDFLRAFEDAVNNGEPVFCLEYA